METNNLQIRSHVQNWQELKFMKKILPSKKYTFIIHPIKLGEEIYLKFAEYSRLFSTTQALSGVASWILDAKPQ